MNIWKINQKKKLNSVMNKKMKFKNYKKNNKNY